ncbi:MAG: hypothetical protein JST00_11130 [Deltaproteobacteria bacterium]|nr:hypothetical protein [Deltaproteobacteria bacterium]
MKHDTNPGERRRRRSEDPLVALHYQLTETRSRGEIDAIVVADASGVVVAGAGSWPVCEELAAFAPLLAEGSWAIMTGEVSSRVESLRKDVEVRLLVVGGQEVLLCARRQRRSAGSPAGEGMARDLDLAAQGISRILAAAA